MHLKNILVYHDSQNKNLSKYNKRFEIQSKSRTIHLI